MKKDDRSISICFVLNNRIYGMLSCLPGEALLCTLIIISDIKNVVWLEGILIILEYEC